jgi:hypothetical protein
MRSPDGVYILLRRVPEDLHTRMKIEAARQRVTLQAWCVQAFREAVAAERPGEGTVCDPDETGVSVHTSV